MINSLYHPEEFIRNIWVTIANEKVWRGELKNKAKDGTYYWVDTTIVPFVNESGKPYQYIAIRSDITQRKELETEIMQMNQELQIRVEEKAKEVIEKEHQYRFLLENMREGIQVIGYDWKYLFVNNSLVEQGKYSNEWFELSYQPVPEGLFILSMDITERKKADNGLLNSLKEITDYKYAINE